MRVMLVDDSEVNLSVYRGVLTPLEHVEVESYVSPVAALARASEAIPALLIVDYHMPELDGIAFVERFRALPLSDASLIVMVTADVERRVRHQALEAGVNDFLTKPFHRVEFLARVRNLLALSQSRRQLSDRAEWLREAVERATAEITAREIETIMRLTRAAEFRDDITGMHVLRVGQMSAVLARTMGLSDDESHMMLLAAPMHDIGKVSTPDAILLKPGPLTDAEFTIMKQHAAVGYEILKDSKSSMLRCAAEIALTHHERFDGSGYPHGLRGSEIPVTGRICSVADVFDALTSVRSYKHAWPIDEATAAIHAGSGTQFDPQIVACFEKSFGEIVAIKKRFADTSPDVASRRGALLSL